MGLFHSHPSQPNDKELELQSQLRQAAAAHEAAVTAALEWTARWALPECQVERVDSAATGYQWQLWHTREDNSKFVDVTVSVTFEDRHPDRPTVFQVEYKTPGGWLHIIESPITREDLYSALRGAVAYRH